MKKYLTIAVAAAALAIGSLSFATDASARGGHGGGMRGHGGGHFHGMRHGGHGHHKHWGHWGHKWYGFYGHYSPCYWVYKPYGAVKVCPGLYY